VDEAGAVVDDGTATGELRLVGDAAPLLALLEPVSRHGDRAGPAGPDARIEVASAVDLARLGDLGEALPLASAASEVEPGIPGSSPSGGAAGAAGGIAKTPALSDGHGRCARRRAAPRRPRPDGHRQRGVGNARRGEGGAASGGASPIESPGAWPGCRGLTRGGRPTGSRRSAPVEHGSSIREPA